MDFEKKLVILTGKTGRGTALIERNGLGTFITLNAFSLPDLTAGEYALGIKNASAVYRREVGSLGRIKSRFSVPVEGDTLHLVVFRTADEEVVLYGTTASQRMWDGNLMDGLRSEKLGKTASLAAAGSAAAQEFSYSERKIEDYFLQIDPSVYNDGAVTSVNYFAYSPRVPQGGVYYDVPPTPDEMQRRYLRTRFGGGHASRQAEEQIASSAQPQTEEVADSVQLHAQEEITDETSSVEDDVWQAESESVAQTAPRIAQTATQSTAVRIQPQPRTTERAISQDSTERTQPRMTQTAQPQATQSARANTQPVPAARAESAAAFAVGQERQDEIPRIKRASEYTVEQAVAAAKTEAGFFTRIKDKIGKLFEDGERFAPLEEALPGTRWVRIAYDDRGRYYTVGLIGDAPDYIAYGVPGTYGDCKLEGADFVPLHSADPLGDGFWVLFQSAVTGEEINS